MCCVIASEDYWSALSGIGTIISAFLALWNNPTLFNWYGLKIRTAKIFTKGNRLCGYAVVSNKRKYEVIVNQMAFVFGKKQLPLLFGRDEERVLKPYETKELFFDLVQTFGTSSTDKTIHIKNLDSHDMDFVEFCLETSLGRYSHDLTSDELKETIKSYNQITEQKVKK